MPRAISPPKIASAPARTHTVVENRKARFLYELLQRLEAGIVLRGTEVKSLRLGAVDLTESFCRITPASDVELLQARIAPYEQGGYTLQEPTRPRRLLLTRREILRLRQSVRKRGLTLVPTKIYFTRGKAKVEIALAQGKKRHDKRDRIRERDLRREQRDLSVRNR